jgi:hypothetical protein
MSRAMAASTDSAGMTGSTKVLPSPPPRPPLAVRHLDAALLAVIQHRKLEPSVLPGVPFH